MALRDQPYLPLYIQDIMTDEKLNECCAATQGIYIKGIMCLMHKSETYGKLLLKQKYKQTSSKEKNFASMLARHLPYSEVEISDAITELIREGVCQYEDDYLIQKRMVKDNSISELRSNSGKRGGEKTQVKNTVFKEGFALAKSEANTEYEYEYENESKIVFNNYPRDENLKIDLPEKNVSAIIEYYKINKNQVKTNGQIKSEWEFFKIQNLTGKKFYKNESEIFTHFMNVIKKEQSNGISKNRGLSAEVGRPGTILTAL